ncbi:Pyridoxal 5'-phosphate synthase subunit PdxT [Galdieria sulphuraria]|uniref:glutaminase n=1 Tax=Galdieria sulphuraria TaxID=130081 RepID=M2VUU5_GALSU|nr:glutamine amidotransferase [Galdieria sulphuraria]EME26971.1 glutamine amidotransferase [Galdieria sulphuraria]GJD11016.1 Pyridoxal 5'-phosphate synthase subunit PdxT [Galdieria sulphuraria]|eukprot:XP_005703491.1 glutamine amidotransferase [Galdieria sulphuraria]
MSNTLRIGVLELQGDFLEHEAMLKQCDGDILTIPVKGKQDLDNIDGLVIPGGESTTIGRLIEEFDMLETIQKRGSQGLPMFGTCAGCILLAKDIVGRPTQTRLGLMNITVDRNAYGPQTESFETQVYSPRFKEKPLRAVLIRAPTIVRVESGVQILACKGSEKEPILVQEGNWLASTFHPELTDDKRIHLHFLDIVKAYKSSK